MRKLINLLPGVVHLFITFSIISSNADKNPIGIPLGLITNPYRPPGPQPEGYHYKKPDQCIADSSNTPDTVITPGLNDGKPYYNCRYSFTNLTGFYFKANDTYYPCIEPELIGTVKVGEPLPKELDIIKGVRQSVAAVFPPTTPNSLPFVVGLVNEGFVLFKNTSIPHDLPRNLQYNQAVNRKIQLRKRDTRLYYESQVEQAKSIFSTLSSQVEKEEAEIFHFNLNRPDDKKLYSASHIASVVETFSTAITRRAAENSSDRDLIETNEVFGLGGARIEFQSADKVADKISRMFLSNGVVTVNLRALGDSPLSASANALDMFGNYLQLAQTTGFSFISSLYADTQNIEDLSKFNFPVPPIPVAYCNRKLEIDPINRITGMNMGCQTGKTTISAPPK